MFLPFIAIALDALNKDVWTFRQPDLETAAPSFRPYRLHIGCGADWIRSRLCRSSSAYSQMKELTVQ